jgi:hypothetical protein
MLPKILFILFFLSVFSSGQTCIIVYKTIHEITVGTDGMQTGSSYFINKKELRTNKDSVIKTENVKKGGKFYFAISGFATEKINSAAIESCKKGKNASEIAAIFKEKRLKSFADEMFDAKTYHTEYYRSNFLNK